MLVAVSTAPIIVSVRTSRSVGFGCTVNRTIIQCGYVAVLILAMCMAMTEMGNR